MAYNYEVGTQLTGQETWHPWLTCQTSEALAEVIRMLLREDIDGPTAVRVLKIHREELPHDSE